MPGDRVIVPAADNATKNRIYDALWSRTKLARPERFNTWPLIASLLPEAQKRLEVGPGLRPRIPIAGTCFIDLSAPVVERLNSCGVLAQLGDLPKLPHEDATFDLVCAFDLIAHVEDDHRACGELSCVLKEDGLLIFSGPLHAVLWNSFDDLVGHVRRYEPSHLSAILQNHKLVLKMSAIFGMQPASVRLLTWGIWLLTHKPGGALFCYNWVLLPLGLLFQKPPKFFNQMIDTDEADEVVLVCRRGQTCRQALNCFSKGGEKPSSYPLKFDPYAPNTPVARGQWPMFRFSCQRIEGDLLVQHALTIDLEDGHHGCRAIAFPMGTVTGI